MKVLAVGNSFSEDATRYLHEIAKADGCDLTVVNLYLGGCSLNMHYKNILTDAKAYELEFNGCGTGFKASIKEALLAHDWDFVAIQQVSSQSTDYETYQPYLEYMVKYIKKYAPKTKLVIHQTWAYEQGSPKLAELGYKDRRDMNMDIKAAYRRAAKDTRADMTIPSGELFQKMTGAGIERLHRDGYHASLGLGRYALGLLWYAALTGRSVMQNTFADLDEPILPEEAEIARKCVDALCVGGGVLI